jgi:enoyl-CoA hydratase
METGTAKMLAVKRDGVGWMTFNQPDKHNAVSLDMWQAIPRIMAAFEGDPDVRVIVLHGAGDKAFVSGADISEFETKRSDTQSVEIYNTAVDVANEAIAAAKKPTISMISGICYGGGLGLALTTDLRFAAHGSAFAVPAAKLGLGYGYVGIKRLADVVGPSFAKEIFFTARKFSTDEALAMGLINRAVPPAELQGYVDALASTIAGNAPLTIAVAKQAINAVAGDHSQQELEAIATAVDGCFTSQDYQEGREAFMEKRKPQFKGR